MTAADLKLISKLVSSDSVLQKTEITGYVGTRVSEDQSTSGSLIRRGVPHGLPIPYIDALYLAIKVREQQFKNKYKPVLFF
jgi:hypothetical protein